MTVKFGFSTPQRRPAMAMLNVKTRPGRRVDYEGKTIPQDQFVSLPDNHHVRRLIHHWGDLILEGEEDIEPVAIAAPEHDKKTEH
jgi:hypothetical protein